MLENIDRIIEFVTTIATVLFVICRSNSNLKKKIDEHLTPNGGNSVRDIIDRIDRKLMTLEATQRALLDLHEENAGHFLAGKDGHFFWVSDKFSEIVEREREDCLGLEWIEAANEAQKVVVFSNWGLATNNATTSNFSFTTKHGLRIQLRSVPVLDQKDKPIGFVGNIKRIE